jgi:hypothetical protein
MECKASKLPYSKAMQRNLTYSEVRTPAMLVLLIAGSKNTNMFVFHFMPTFTKISLISVFVLRVSEEKERSHSVLRYDNSVPNRKYFPQFPSYVIR